VTQWEIPINISKPTRVRCNLETRMRFLEVEPSFLVSKKLINQFPETGSKTGMVGTIPVSINQFF
jgi:hypothetical protein